MKGMADYDFETITPFDYSCVIKLTAGGRMMSRMFVMAKNTARRKHRLRSDQSPDHIIEFEIPKRFYNALGIAVKGIMKNVEKEVLEDNIRVVTSNVSAAVYKKNSDGNWDVFVTVSGGFVRV